MFYVRSSTQTPSYTRTRKVTIKPGITRTEIVTEEKYNVIH